MIKCVRYRRADKIKGGSIEVDIPLSELPAALADPASLVWIDLTAPTADEVKAILVDTFDFHPLTIDDCLGEPQRPKLDDFDEYIFIVTHALSQRSLEHGVETTEFDLYLGTDFVVTCHLKPCPAILELADAITRDPRPFAHGADRLAAELLQRAAGDYWHVLDAVDDVLEDLEEEIFRRPGHNAVSRLYQLRRRLVTLRRTVAPQRELLNRLAWDSFEPVRAENRIYFREAYDLLVRVSDLLEGQRDLAAGALETYLSVVSNRLNSTMRWLAAISTLFMPLTLISSIYGMNFADMPPFGLEGGWILIVGGMAVIGWFTYWYFRRRRWL